MKSDKNTIAISIKGIVWQHWKLLIWGRSSHLCFYKLVFNVCVLCNLKKKISLYSSQFPLILSKCSHWQIWQNIWGIALILNCLVNMAYQNSNFNFRLIIITFIISGNSPHWYHNVLCCWMIKHPWVVRHIWGRLVHWIHRQCLDTVNINMDILGVVMYNSHELMTRSITCMNKFTGCGHLHIDISGGSAKIPSFIVS